MVNRILFCTFNYEQITHLLTKKKSFLHVYIYMFLKKEKPETDDFEEKNFGSKQEILFK